MKESDMALFMDVHDIEGGVSADDVAAAHEKDLETQVRYGVNYLNYWVSEPEGKIFCLVEARIGSRRARRPPRRPRTGRRRDLRGGTGMRRRLAVAAAVASSLAAALAACAGDDDTASNPTTSPTTVAAPDHPADLQMDPHERAAAMLATAGFQDVATAEAAGYASSLDTATRSRSSRLEPPSTPSPVAPIGKRWPSSVGPCARSGKSSGRSGPSCSSSVPTSCT
jgi:hypothetical protein